jgi:hypothetical protein
MTRLERVERALRRTFTQRAENACSTFFSFSPPVTEALRWSEVKCPS